LAKVNYCCCARQASINIIILIQVAPAMSLILVSPAAVVAGLDCRPPLGGASKSAPMDGSRAARAESKSTVVWVLYLDPSIARHTDTQSIWPSVKGQASSSVRLAYSDVSDKTGRRMTQQQDGTQEDRVTTDCSGSLGR
jgi:hypothetical protein